MQRRLSAFNNYTIEAPDGNVGYVSDILFEDNSWKLRWFVITAGSWLFGRKLLIHPTALERPDIRQRAFPVTLTKAQVEASPEINRDPPVTVQMQQNLNACYAYSPIMDIGAYGGYGAGSADGNFWRQNDAAQAGDPNLRSLAEIVGYHIHALDGDIGHLEPGVSPLDPIFLKVMVSKGIAFGGFRREGEPVAKGVWGSAPALLPSKRSSLRYYFTPHSSIHPVDRPGSGGGATPVIHLGVTICDVRT